MRNQQVAAAKVNVLYPDIEPSCSDSRSHSKAAAHPKKVWLCLTASDQGGEVTSSSSSPLQAEASSDPAYSSTVCQQKAYPENSKDKVLIAQPVFVHEKKERPVKRHAEHLVLKAENGLSIHSEKRVRSSSFTYIPSHSPAHTEKGVSEKRVRSSSFTVLSSFPPSQPAIKNNVFMPSTIVQVHPESTKTDVGRLQAWNVIKPATLQAPQAPLCQDEKKTTGSGTVFLRCQPEDKLSSIEMDCIDRPKSAPGPTYILGLKTRNQPSEQMFMPDNSTSNFVFGENMDRRVVSPQRPAESQTQCKWGTNSSRVQSSESYLPYQKNCANRSLIESAAAYTAKLRQKYALDKVEVITGEEEERNVLQVNCKLFVLNKVTQMWTERGRGYLRLNDTSCNESGFFKSRLVMRNHGSLKLILNSKIWDEMKLVRASRKNLRIIATDLGDHSLRVFLIQASVKDAGRLYAAIHHRLIALRSHTDKGQDTAHTETETDTNLPLLSFDSEEEEEDEGVQFHSNISDHSQWIRKQPALYS
ncbi:hypothetical protein FKM82_000149 [Ascaphus truei]